MARRSSSADNAGRNTKDHTEEAARRTSLWVEPIARFGYSAKGVVYVVMGVLAVLAAVNAGGGSTTDQNGAFQAIEEAPFGQVLLGVVAIGLTGYVLWRSIQAVADPDGEGLDPKGVAKRIGYAGSALLHAFFAFAAANLAAGAGGDWGRLPKNGPDGSCGYLLGGCSLRRPGSASFLWACTRSMRPTIPSSKSTSSWALWATGRKGGSSTAAGSVSQLAGWSLSSPGCSSSWRASGQMSKRSAASAAPCRRFLSSPFSVTSYLASWPWGLWLTVCLWSP